MLSCQLVKIVSSMFQFISELTSFCLKFFNSCFQKLLFWLSIFGLFFLGKCQPLHLFTEWFLDVLHSLLMFGFIFIEHLLIHIDLLGQTLLNAVSFFLKLSNSICEDADSSFMLSNFRRFFLYLFERGSFLVENIINKFARSVWESCVGSFSKLFRR